MGTKFSGFSQGISEQKVKRGLYLMSNETFWKPRTQVCFLFYLFCSILLVCAVIFLFLPDTFSLVGWLIKSIDLVKEIISPMLAPFFEQMKNIILLSQRSITNAVSSFPFDRMAVQKVSTTIGVTAIALTWLINANQQKVYGVSIGTLLRWAYPGFFRFYFTIFLSLFLVCTHSCSAASSNIHIQVAMALSYIGVLSGTIYFLYIAYTFVLNFERRQDIALSYHYHHVYWVKGCDKVNHITSRLLLHFTLILNGLLSNKHPNYCLGSGNDSDACFQSIEECISILGKSFGTRMVSGETLDVNALYSIWTVTSNYYTSYYKEKGGVDTYGIYSLCFLAQRFWSLALPKDMLMSEQTKLARILLCETAAKDVCEPFVFQLTPLKKGSEEDGSEVKRKDYTVSVNLYPSDCFAAGFLLSFNFESLSDGRLHQIIQNLFSLGGGHRVSASSSKAEEFLLPALVTAYLVLCYNVNASASISFTRALQKSVFWSNERSEININSEQKQRFEDFLITVYNADILEKGWGIANLAFRDEKAVADDGSSEDLMAQFNNMARSALEVNSI